MGRIDLDDEQWKEFSRGVTKLIVSVVVCVVIIILVMFIAVIVAVSQLLPQFVMHIQNALAVLGLSITMMCAIVWFLSINGSLQLHDPVEMAIRTVLILGVLSAIVAGIGSAVGKLLH